MSQYVLSPAAQSDLAQLWDYTCERWRADQTETYCARFSEPLNS